MWIWGPLAWPTRRGKALGVLLVALLTLTTEVGGLFAWPALGLAAGAPARALGLVVAAHGVSLLAVPPLARLGGRRPLPCLSDGALRPRSLVYCAAHRNYVNEALDDEARQLADDLAAEHPGTVLRYLDAGFPFLDGVPLLPHLSHHDGRNLDVALLYEDADGTPLDGGGSPIGYFGYVPAPAGEAPACAARWLDLRWDMAPLQPWLAPRLDEARTASLVRAAAEREAVGKLLLEPHLQRRLRVASEKLKFQGCHAARHDDHLHLQLR